MKINRIVSQHRRDFTAIYECEHCKFKHTAGGYDDSHFHTNVIPSMKCDECGKCSPDEYRPLTTKYDDSATL